MRTLLAVAQTISACFQWWLSFDAIRYNERIASEYSPEVIAAAHFHPLTPHFGIAIVGTVLAPFLWCLAIRSAER